MENELDESINEEEQQEISRFISKLNPIIEKSPDGKSKVIFSHDGIKELMDSKNGREAFTIENDLIGLRLQFISSKYSAKELANFSLSFMEKHFKIIPTKYPLGVY